MKIQRGDECAFKRGAKMIGLPGVHWLLFIGISRYGMKLLRRPESVANTYNELIESVANTYNELIESVANTYNELIESVANTYNELILLK